MPFDRIVSQGYALRAFSCKSHLFSPLLPLAAALFFREPRPCEAVHAFWNQFGFDARKTYEHASSARIGLVPRHPIAAGGVHAHARRFRGGEQLALTATIAGRHEQMQAGRAAENFNFVTHLMLQAFHKQIAAFVICRHGCAGIPVPITFGHK